MADEQNPQVPARRARSEVDAVDWVQMIQVLPAADESAAAGIVAGILEAATPEEVNASHSAEGMRELFGHTLRIYEFRRGESQFTEGNPVFVIAEAIDLDSGKEIVATSSADAVLAVAVKFTVSEWLPADFRVVPAAKPTKAGHTPYHLEYLGRPL